MSLKSLKKGYASLKQELHIMQALKFGKISHTIKNQIYGLLDVFFTSWLALKCLLKQRIWKVYIKKLQEGYIPESLLNIRKI